MYDYDDAVLLAISKEPGYAGWYKIEVRLSNMDVATRKYLPDTLRELVAKGLIEEDSENRGTYRLTDRGAAVVEQLCSGDET